MEYIYGKEEDSKKKNTSQIQIETKADLVGFNEDYVV
jgi:hypothetical protein